MDWNLRVAGLPQGSCLHGESTNGNRKQAGVRLPGWVARPADPPVSQHLSTPLFWFLWVTPSFFSMWACRAVSHDDFVAHLTSTSGQTHESGWQSQATTPGHSDSFREGTRPKQGQTASSWRPLHWCWERDFLSYWRWQNWDYLEPRLLVVIT